MNPLLFLFSKSNTRYFFLISLAVFLTFPLCSLATASYVPLVGIPGVSSTGGGNLTQYLNRLYLLTISIGAIIAVVKIFMAGIKWSMSDIVTDKSSAKSDIRGALLGLAILLIPFIVLNEIYPDLTNMNFLRNAPTVTLTPNPSSGVTAGEAANESRRFCEQSRGVYDRATGSCDLPPDGSNDLNENRRFCEQSGGSFNMSTGVCTSAADPATGDAVTIPTGSFEYEQAQFTGEVLQGWVTYCGGPTHILVTPAGDKTRLSCK